MKRITEHDFNRLVNKIIKEDKKKFDIGGGSYSDETTHSDVITQNRKWSDMVYDKIDSFNNTDSIESLEKTIGKLYLAKTWIKGTDKRSSIQDKIDSIISSFNKRK
jgi:hypothetical protein